MTTGGGTRLLDVLVTAAEGFPAFERLWLGAEREIWASFRIFDLRTQLRSPEALAVGETWGDLVTHVLARGVKVRMVLSDFDPSVATWLHRGTWAQMRRFYGAAEMAGDAADLQIVAAIHPAQSAAALRTLLWPGIQARMSAWTARLNDLDATARLAELRDSPGIHDRLILNPDDMAVGAKLARAPALHPCSHHQKLFVVDRRTLAIGGLDLDERRWDTPEHNCPGHETWHDVSVVVEGEAVPAAQAHIESFLDTVAGLREPDPPTPGFIRTLSRRRRRNWLSIGPEPLVAEHRQAHSDGIARAQRLIYLETQYFRDRALAEELAEAAAAKPDLGLILLLPGAPEDIAYEGNLGLDARHGEQLQADAVRLVQAAFGDRCFVGGVAQPREADDPPPVITLTGAGPLPATMVTHTGRHGLLGAALIYLHSKVSIFDDALAIVGSANLNGRSMDWDTEASVVLDLPEDVRRVREKVMRAWLPAGSTASDLDPAQVVARWRALAEANAGLDPDRRSGFLLPFDVQAAADFGKTVPGMPDAMV